MHAHHHHGHGSHGSHGKPHGERPARLFWTKRRIAIVAVIALVAMGVFVFLTACDRAPQPKGPAPIVPPTMAHLEKLRLYALFCPDGCGPNARVHYTFDAAWHAPIHAGETLLVEGLVARRYAKRGRDYMEMQIAIRRAADGALCVEYTDTVCLSYREAATGEAV